RPRLGRLGLGARRSGPVALEDAFAGSDRPGPDDPRAHGRPGRAAAGRYHAAGVSAHWWPSPPYLLPRTRPAGARRPPRRLRAGGSAAGSRRVGRPEGGEGSRWRHLRQALTPWPPPPMLG